MQGREVTYQGSGKCIYFKWIFLQGFPRKNITASGSVIIAGHVTTFS